MYRALDYMATDPAYCFCEARPRGEYFPAYKLTDGHPVGAEYPDDPLTVEMHFHPDKPGVQLPSFIGNTGRLVLVHRDVAAFVQRALEVPDVEVFPFALYNHKGRLHSTDYVFLNVLGTYDCMDYDRSEYRRRKDGSISMIRTLVLRSDRLNQATADLLRVQDAASTMLVSERARRLFSEQGFTNLNFRDITSA